MGPNGGVGPRDTVSCERLRFSRWCSCRCEFDCADSVLQVVPIQVAWYVESLVGRTEVIQRVLCNPPQSVEFDRSSGGWVVSFGMPSGDGVRSAWMSSGEKEGLL